MTKAVGFLSSAHVLKTIVVPMKIFAPTSVFYFFSVTRYSTHDSPLTHASAQVADFASAPFPFPSTTQPDSAPIPSSTFQLNPPTQTYCSTVPQSFAKVMISASSAPLSSCSDYQKTARNPS